MEELERNFPEGRREDKGEAQKRGGNGCFWKRAVTRP